MRDLVTGIMALATTVVMPAVGAFLLFSVTVDPVPAARAFAERPASATLLMRR